jgi:hypothetical protein
MPLASRLHSNVENCSVLNLCDSVCAIVDAFNRDDDIMLSVTVKVNMQLRFTQYIQWMTYG